MVVRPYLLSHALFVVVLSRVYSLKGIKFIAQWQATLGASPWVVDERELRPVKGKSPMCQAGRFLLLPLIGRTIRVKCLPRVSPHSVRLALGYALPGLSARHSLLTTLVNKLTRYEFNRPPPQLCCSTPFISPVIGGRKSLPSGDNLGCRDKRASFRMVLLTTLY